MRIKVYSFDPDHYIPEENHYIETIERKPFNRGWMGNFVPHWTRYKRNIYLVKGSLSYSYMHGYDNDAYIVINEPIREEDAQ